jgi:hypothetical protein
MPPENNDEEDGMVQTMMSDITHTMSSFGLTDISMGDFVNIKAYIGDSGEVVAVKVHRKKYDTQQQQQVKGPVTAINDDMTIAVMGIAVDVSGFPELVVAVGDVLEASGHYDEENNVFVPNDIALAGDWTDGEAMEPVT